MNTDKRRKMQKKQLIETNSTFLLLSFSGFFVVSYPCLSVFIRGFKFRAFVPIT